MGVAVYSMSINTEFQPLGRYLGASPRKWCSQELFKTAICFYFMEKDNLKRPLRHNTDFLRSVSLYNELYDSISKILKDKEASEFVRNTYYIVDKTFKNTNAS